MKIKQDFVTNSSSSSFIIAGKDKPKMIVEMDIMEFVETTIVDLKGLDSWFVDEYGYDATDLEEILEDEYLKESYEKAKDAIQKGMKIFIGSVCNDSDNGNEAEIYNNGFSGKMNFDIITDANN